MRHLILISVLLSMGAEFRSTNFVVTAPHEQIARQMAQWAEHYRKEKAEQWLGSEMPAWPQPCPLKVTVTLEPPQGKTSFTYKEGAVMGMDMEIQGPLDRLIYSVLPHEVTHTILAHHFGCAVPRWADEGAAVLSEDKAERDRHDQMTRTILNQGQGFRLRTLMNLTDYPAHANEVMWLYAQGNSVCKFLVQRSDRKTFLTFVKKGIDANSWDQAVQDCYGLKDVEDLEEAWLKHLRITRRQDLVAEASVAARPVKPKPRQRPVLPPPVVAEPAAIAARPDVIVPFSKTPVSGLARRKP